MQGPAAEARLLAARRGERVFRARETGRPACATANNMAEKSAQGNGGREGERLSWAAESPSVCSSREGGTRVSGQPQRALGACAPSSVCAVTSVVPAGKKKVGALCLNVL